MSATTIVANPFSELKIGIEIRQARVGIIGLGYVGLPLALLYSQAGFQVTGFDIDAHKVATLISGGSYTCRIPPAEIQAARKWIANHASLVVDTRNAMRGIHGDNIVRC